MKTVENLLKERNKIDIKTISYEELTFWNNVSDAIKKQDSLEKIFRKFVHLISLDLPSTFSEDYEEQFKVQSYTGDYIDFFSVTVGDRGMALSTLEKIKRFCGAKDIFVSGGNMDPYMLTYELIYEIHHTEEEWKQMENKLIQDYLNNKPMKDLND